MTSLTPDEMFAAGHSGNYLLDPKTGTRTLLQDPESTTAAPNDGKTCRKRPDPDQVRDDLRG
jgi:hypothetical protein